MNPALSFGAGHRLVFRDMPLLFVHNDGEEPHDAGRDHPERPARLGAVFRGVHDSGVADDVEWVVATPASRDALTSVHPESMVERVEQLSGAGGGYLDADTGLNDASWSAAQLAAGAGLLAVDRLVSGTYDAAFCAVRPPGHHATDKASMGFCLFNNVAVTARRLADRGERVVIVDYDAHHGNGTQDIFYEDPSVLFVSFHQYPAYPGTGSVHEIGAGAGAGTTLNIALPPGATGDVYRRAWDQVAGPVVERFDPTWLLLSAGFDAHRADPITSMGLSAGDFGPLTESIIGVVPKGRRIAFLEGGYDLDALRKSTASCVAALDGERYVTERETSGGPGYEVVDFLVERDRRGL